MADYLLRTKLFIPPIRPALVPRPRLVQKLNDGLGGKLTLICAPAGFGKTTLISERAAGHESAVAWLSLDEGDNDLTRFLTYLVAALQTVSPQIGEEVLSLLQSPQPPLVESILTALLNEITAIADNFVLVLDDYHLLDAKPVDEALTFLLDHLPPQMHLVITSREDPPLPLARYRARGQLTEVRAGDLRFTPAEATEFLNQMMGLTLSADEIAALETRTEGWITGLQLAALSMQGRAETATFIQAFTGSHHFVLDYLIEEVLQQQPERVRSFLLQTAILDRLSSPLCDAVTDQENDQEDGKEMLLSLARDNLFVVPLDDERQWYRYHRLFADVLHARLIEEQPTQVPILHQRASEWYEQNGLRADAIRHALAAKDFARAADLVELTWPAMHRSDFQSAALLGWLEVIPDEQIRARPVLSVGYAWKLLSAGEFEGAETRLRDAERWIETPNMSTRSEALPGKMIVMDEEEFRSLPAEIASARAYLTMALGDMPTTVTYAQQALALIPEDDYIRHGPAASLLGLAYWITGELQPAYQALAEGMASFRRAGNILFAITGTFGLADIRIAQGQLHAAISTYEKSLQLAMKQGEPALRGTADLHLGLSELYCEQGAIDAANEHLQSSQELGEQAGQQVFQYHMCLVQARSKQSQGDLGGALRLLDEAEDLFNHIHIPDLRPVAALKTRARLAQGQLTEAQRWVHERSLSVDDDLSYLREFEHITLARVLIAQSKNDQSDGAMHQAIGFLDRLLHAAEVGERMGSVIEILLLQALAHEAQGDSPIALVALERALTLAAPEGYVRTFVDEGMPMAHLLRAALAHGIMSDYMRKLLTAFAAVEQKPTGDAPLPTVKTPASPPSGPLIEPLSERELDVLRLLRTELSGPEIAHELSISLNTFRTHSKNIYSKLGVNNRRAAVRRGAELDLL